MELVRAGTEALYDGFYGTINASAIRVRLTGEASLLGPLVDPEKAGGRLARTTHMITLAATRDASFDPLAMQRRMERGRSSRQWVGDLFVEPARFDGCSAHIASLVLGGAMITTAARGDIYLRWGNAYRAGGANSRSAIFRPFNEKVVSTWEFGLKSDLFDRHMRVNLAAYYSRLKDMQLDFVSPANPSATETVNGTKDAEIKGVELDVTVAPGGGFTLNGSYSYTDAKVPPRLNPFSGLTERFRVSQTPKHAGTLALDYRFPAFSIGTLVAHVDANWSSGVYSSSSDLTKSNAVAVLNGRLTLRDIALGDSKMELALWGKNLTNVEYQLFDFALASPGLLYANQTHFNEPRSYGVEARLRF